MAEGINGRIPPHNADAEKSALGAMMLDHHALSMCVEKLNSEDFYYPAHGRLFSVIRDLMLKNVPVDIVTVSDELAKRGLLEDCGGAAFLAEISNYVPSASNIASYIDIIKDKAVLRKLISSLSRVVDECYSGVSDTRDVILMAEKVIFELSQANEARDFVTALKAVNEAYAIMEELYENPDSQSHGIPTGFTTIDEKIQNMQNSQLIVVGARASMGKSSFGINIIEFAAKYRQKSTAYFSLEMPYVQIAQRMLSSGSRVPLQNIRSGRVADNEWDKLAKARNDVGGARVFIDDTPGITTSEILSKCRRLKLEYGLDLICIDYLQLVNPGSTSRRESRTLDVSDITRNLKLMARELDIPVIVLSQLSRAVESRADKRPQLADLRESGSIEQDADIVMLIYRGSYYGDMSAGTDVEINIAKNRNGPVGKCMIAWNGDTASFENVDTTRG